MLNFRKKRRSPEIVAIANQKGGVGKTTTAINLGAALAQFGRRILVLDMDPQGNASTGLGADADKRGDTTREVLSGEASLVATAMQTQLPGLFLIPSTTDLHSADMVMASQKERVYFLRNAIKKDAENLLEYDFAFVDCPPSLNLLTINALAAADSLLSPLQSEFFALEGLSQLILTMREIRKSVNPMLKMEGIVLTMHDSRNNLSRMVESDARNTLKQLVYETVIPRNVTLGEAPSFGKPVVVYDKRSRGAVAYRELAAEFLRRREQKKNDS
ncbi:MAG: ParA family protein [Albidovulum sp.]|nr:ParA family protein [Albidovulum sp.]MDE0307749.1 ParA family protein [Albidovulum sp.]MDE0532077.1 ParA family protein [Albidovulum sp.]